MPLLDCSQLGRTSPPTTQTSQQTFPCLLWLCEEDAGGRQRGRPPCRRGAGLGATSALSHMAAQRRVCSIPA